MALKDQIALFRRQAGMSIEALAMKSGVPISTVKKISAGITKDPQIETLRAIAYALGKTLDDFNDSSTNDSLESYDIMPMPKMKYVPLVGSIACGTPITAVENVEDMVSVPWDVPCDFVLRCKGDSMAPRLLDGDLVFIRQQPDVHDGQIAVIIHDGEATLKHVYHIPGAGVQLVAENPVYPPMVFTSANSDELRIVGLAVSYQRNL